MHAFCLFFLCVEHLEQSEQEKRGRNRASSLQRRFADGTLSRLREPALDALAVEEVKAWKGFCSVSVFKLGQADAAALLVRRQAVCRSNLSHRKSRNGFCARHPRWCSSSKTLQQFVVRGARGWFIRLCSQVAARDKIHVARKSIQFIEETRSNEASTCARQCASGHRRSVKHGKSAAC